jgi:hypothetical protein
MTCDKGKSAGSYEDWEKGGAVGLSGCNVAESSMWYDWGWKFGEEIDRFEKMGVSTLMTVKATPSEPGVAFQ